MKYRPAPCCRFVARSIAPLLLRPLYIQQLERDNHTFSPSCKPLISKIKTANDNGNNMLRSIAVKGIFTERSKMKDTKRKNNGINIFFVSKFIASNKTM